MDIYLQRYILRNMFIPLSYLSVKDEASRQMIRQDFYKDEKQCKTAHIKQNPPIIIQQLKHLRVNLCFRGAITWTATRTMTWQHDKVDKTPRSCNHFPLQSLEKWL